MKLTTLVNEIKEMARYKGDVEVKVVYVKDLLNNELRVDVEVEYMDGEEFESFEMFTGKSPAKTYNKAKELTEKLEVKLSSKDKVNVDFTTEVAK